MVVAGQESVMGFIIVILQLTVADCRVVGFTTCAVKLNVPCVNGPPEITPLVASRESPSGRLPDTIE